jgi:hypothetical protein
MMVEAAEEEEKARPRQQLPSTMGYRRRRQMAPDSGRGCRAASHFCGASPETPRPKQPKAHTTLAGKEAQGGEEGEEGEDAQREGEEEGARGSGAVFRLPPHGRRLVLQYIPL